MVSLLHGAERLIDLISAAISYVSGAAFLFLAYYISWDVAGRYFGFPYSGVSDEVSGYTLAVAGTWGMAHALRHDSHVRIEALVQVLPPVLQRVLAMTAYATMAFFAALLSWYSWRLAYESGVIGKTGISMLQAPLVVPQSLLAAGLTMLTIQAVAMLLRSAVTLRNGGPPDAGEPGAPPVHQI